MSGVNIELGKKEKKEVINMPKRTMNEVNSDYILEVLKEKDLGIDIPDKVVVLKINEGTYETKDKQVKPWVNLEVAAQDEYNDLKAINREKNATRLKLKIANYDGQSLEYLIGKLIDISSSELAFLEKYNSIVGLAFRIDLKDIKVVD